MVGILSSMEVRGIRVEKNYLEEIGVLVREQLSQCQQAIYDCLASSLNERGIEIPMNENVDPNSRKNKSNNNNSNNNNNDNNNNNNSNKNEKSKKKNSGGLVTKDTSHHFNIDSPEQVAYVLFHVLKLPSSITTTTAVVAAATATATGNCLEIYLFILLYLNLYLSPYLYPYLYL